MRSERNNEEIRKRRKRIFENTLGILILLAILLGGVTGYYGSKVVSFLDGISESDEEIEEDPVSKELSKQLADSRPFAALILGTDIEEDGQSRSDTIIVVTVNPKEGSMKMVSIPRDTLITLPDGSIEKINAAYTTGGATLSRIMIGDMLGIPIQFYATMDFRGLVELVDAVGGITIDSQLEFTQDNYVDFSKPVVIKKGKQILDGAEALGYARMRYQDPRGDFGRQDRQKEVIVEILNQLVSLNTVTNLSNILNSIQPYLKTNASSNQMLAMAGNYTGVLNDIEQLTLEGVAGEAYFPHYGFNVYVWEPYQYSLIEVSQILRDHLEIEDSTDNDIDDSEEIYENTY